MAEASISVDQDQFSCAVCLDRLNDPVTTPCGHSFCKLCINGCWDQEDVKGIYSCPQCRETYTPRPVLHRNNMLAEVVEKLKKTEQAASPAVSAKAERTKKQNEIKEDQIKSQQRIQEKQKKVQELKQTVDVIKIRSQAAVDDSERIFTDII
ncbi:E3 ubiquitin/ISG15 ligase TRIM25-like, partial [Tachysurus fulvidraco]|uniref:E3 ubiquitin/ISG15 ligase TRIM25-like n=1 Tax=Tachysurus fulvidraco TaxID=1234273 RepID=UPI001FED2B3F